MSTRRNLLGLACLFAVGLSGCVGELDEGNPRVDAGPPPDTPEEVPPALVRSVRAFGCDLLGELDDGNVCVSPYSISVVLAMTYAGARGGTREAMADALRYHLDGEALHGGFAALDAELDERDEADTDHEPFALTVANPSGARRATRSGTPSVRRSMRTTASASGTQTSKATPTASATTAP